MMKFTALVWQWQQLEWPPDRAPVWAGATCWVGESAGLGQDPVGCISEIVKKNLSDLSMAFSPSLSQQLPRAAQFSKLMSFSSRAKSLIHLCFFFQNRNFFFIFEQQGTDFQALSPGPEEEQDHRAPQGCCDQVEQACVLEWVLRHLSTVRSQLWTLSQFLNVFPGRKCSFLKKNLAEVAISSYICTCQGKKWYPTTTNERSSKEMAFKGVVAFFFAKQHLGTRDPSILLHWAAFYIKPCLTRSQSMFFAPM